MDGRVTLKTVTRLLGLVSFPVETYGLRCPGAEISFQVYIDGLCSEMVFLPQSLESTVR